MRAMRAWDLPLPGAHGPAPGSDGGEALVPRPGTHTGLFFLPALVLLAVRGVKLWREQSEAGAAPRSSSHEALAERAEYEHGEEEQAAGDHDHPQPVTGERRPGPVPRGP